MSKAVRQQRVAVIMAGGAGERFWPLSRKLCPKQLLRLGETDQSLLEATLELLLPLISPEQIHIQTTPILAAPIRSALQKTATPEKNVLVEPDKRNTAGCLCYATAHLLAHNNLAPECITMAIVPADGSIGDTTAYRNTVRLALETAEQETALVTVGIPPTYPATGFGYIEASQEVTTATAIPVAAFHEKPDRDTAQRYVDSGKYFWNAGMFFWTVQTFLNELEKAQPAMAHTVCAMAEAMRRNAVDEVNRLFSTLESISIDYALMEHAEKIYMAPATFAWDDLGSWAALDRCRSHDSAGNICIGDTIASESTNSIIYNAAEGRKITVATLGIDNLVVVVTDDAVLVMPKDRSEDLRTITTLLTEDHNEKL